MHKDFVAASSVIGLAAARSRDWRGQAPGHRSPSEARHEGHRSRTGARAALCLLAAEPGAAAGPFDGVWTGRSVTDFGWCPQSYEVELRIRDGNVSGEMVTNSERIKVASRVSKRGRLTSVLGYNGGTVLRTVGGRLGARKGRIKWMGRGSSTFAKDGGGICYGTIELEKVS